MLEEVYGLYKNADMTEGRGPMVLTEPLWSSEDVAWEQANTHLGVMGIAGARDHAKLRQNGHERFVGTCPGWQCKLCYPDGGNWQVRKLRMATVEEENSTVTYKAIRISQATYHLYVEFLLEIKSQTAIKSLTSIDTMIFVVDSRKAFWLTFDIKPVWSGLPGWTDWNDITIQPKNTLEKEI